MTFHDLVITLITFGDDILMTLMALGENIMITLTTLVKVLRRFLLQLVTALWWTYMTTLMNLVMTVMAF